MVSERTPLYEVTVQAGATFVDEAGWLVPDRYGDPDGEYRRACQNVVLFDRSHHGKVELRGSDAHSFLHNLSSGDILHLAVGAGCEAFWLNAKARVVAHGFIYHVALPDGREAYWLELVPGLADKLMKHLDHHLISEQVEIVDRTRDFAEVHVTGPGARALLGKVLGEGVLQLGELQVLVQTDVPCQIRRHDPLGAAGYDLICPRDRAEEVWHRLTAAGAQPAGRQAYEMLRVEAGTPLYGIDVDETTLAMEVGRTQQAISFTKGCYLGQEPVVRSRDLGHVNRSLRGVKIAAAQAIPRGAKLMRAEAEVGHITSSVVSPRLGTALALAYVRRGHQEPGTSLTVVSDQGSWPAEVVSLPLAGRDGSES